ncbi:unnamed protein product [Tetraodon nigroviridis]|uniref:(spotted green pufferfish) hypothetical protein n=1 Tax=Tetraodon nigroviridis TaxID=99883 RepID=Q4SSY0_TETNG|nr:unnamed protein product [Tetraodon nigroviridis]
MSGQTLTDRIAAAQYSLTGSEVSRAVCKATTHEQTAPKKKHMECKSSICPSINPPIHLVLLTLILPCANRPSWCLPHAPVWGYLFIYLSFPGA